MAQRRTYKKEDFDAVQRQMRFQAQMQEAASVPLGLSLSERTAAVENAISDFCASGRTLRQRPEKTSRSNQDFNERTHDLGRRMGYWAYRADYYDHLLKRHFDFMGIFDWVWLGNGETVGVQHTSKSNVSARIEKIMGSKGFEKVKAAGWKVLVIGWGKNASGRWEADLRWL